MPAQWRLAGLAVVAAILISALVALYETIQRLIHPQHLSHLWLLAAAGAVGFVGNEIAARVRLRGGRRLDRPALIADGNHARIDGFVSLSRRRPRAGPPAASCLSRFAEGSGGEPNALCTPTPARPTPRMSHSSWNFATVLV